VRKRVQPHVLWRHLQLRTARCTAIRWAPEHHVVIQIRAHLLTARVLSGKARTPHRARLANVARHGQGWRGGSRVSFRHLERILIQNIDCGRKKDHKRNDEKHSRTGTHLLM
jgi:hypothetical protein